jgi:cell volume regulation protein A
VSLQLAVDQVILVGASLLLVGVVASASAERLRVPGLLASLVVGMVLGDDGLDLISFSDAELAQSIAVVALVAILFDGGLSTTAEQLRRVAVPAGLLGTLGVVITAGVVALAAAVLLDVPAETALLAGALVSSTDAAAVFSVLRSAPVASRLRLVLEVESGGNDPIAVLLTAGLLAVAVGDVGAGDWLGFGTRQLAGGLAVGVAVGWAGAALLRRAPLPATSLVPVVGLAVAGLAYGIGAAAGASGFLATYVAGVVVASRAPRWRRPLRRFHEASATTAEIVLFLLLGLLVFPSRLDEVVLPAIGITAVLVLVARPVAVVALLAPLGYGRRELALVSWAGLRGAVPIVLATFPLTDGHPEGELLFDVVFVVVLLASAVQGTTVAAAARRLGVDDVAGGPALTEVVPVDIAGVDVVELVLAAGSAVLDRPLAEVPLPTGARIGVVQRGDDVLVPTGTTRLQAGDRVVVMAVASPDLDAVVAGWAEGAVRA